MTIPNKSVCSEGSNVIVNRHSRIVLGIEGATPIDELASGHRREAGPVHTKGPAASRSAEKIEDAYQSCSPALFRMS